MILVPAVQVILVGGPGDFGPGGPGDLVPAVRVILGGRSG